ncbi:MAG: AI-2E family transporter [Acidobacteriota bacterium]
MIDVEPQSIAASPRGAETALRGLFILACFYTAYFARDFLLPLGVAVLLKFLLDPLVRRLKRWRVPEAAGAAIVVLAMLGVLGYGVVSLAHPAGEWLASLPASARKLESQLRPWRKPVEQVASAGQQVEKMANLGAEPASASAVPATAPSAASAIGRTVSMLGTFLVTLLLLYFLLASGNLILRKLIKVLPRLQDKKRAVRMAEQIESEVSAYLLTITAINLGFGAAVGVAMWALKMPNPVLWGVLAMAANYLPYLGPTVCVAVLTAVALLTFGTTGTALLVPAAFLALHAVESYFVTPFLVGRRLTLNPLAIFLGVSFWGWVWGVPGALLAVPFMAIFKIFCDHIEGLGGVGEFLGS